MVPISIDPATGDTRIASYVVVETFGATLNPLLLAGHGGTVQAWVKRSQSMRAMIDVRRSLST
jgi:hypothetical protein